MSLTVSCVYCEDIMIHGLWAGFVLPYQRLENSIAKLRMMFHLSFVGHPYEEPTLIERNAVIVPVPRSWH